MSVDSKNTSFMTNKKTAMETCSIVFFICLSLFWNVRFLFDRCLQSCYLKLAEENANTVWGYFFFSILLEGSFGKHSKLKICEKKGFRTLQETTFLRKVEAQNYMYFSYFSTHAMKLMISMKILGRIVAKILFLKVHN